jgi:hypothetical protein
MGESRTPLWALLVFLETTCIGLSRDWTGYLCEPALLSHFGATPGEATIHSIVFSSA